MPPFLTWFAGRDAVAGFVGSQLLTAPGGDRLVPVTANGQAAFAVYRRDERGVYRAHALQVLTLTATGIARIVAFADPGRFTSFGLPPEDPACPGDELVVFLGRRPFRGDSEGSAWSA
jgi:RNA polymerase sigma-70 factor (ECF subfamily)